MPLLSSPATPTLTLLSGFGLGPPGPVPPRGVFPTVVVGAPATGQEVSAEDDASVCAHILDEM
eukprot:12687948-Alexandrium_andersonii.AAC.1